MRIIFKDNKIQKGYRVKIPKAVVDTLELKEGERIKIEFDAVSKRLIVGREKKRGKNE
jgi:antitoxin component of MazEF toxin-antitoxin module